MVGGTILPNWALGQLSPEVGSLTSPKDPGYVESQAIIPVPEDSLLCLFLTLSCPPAAWSSRQQTGKG